MSMSFPELEALEELIKSLHNHARIEIQTYSKYRKLKFPVYSISLGSTDPKAPTLGFFGGIHGLERIGTRVVLSYLHTIAELLSWDRLIHAIFKHIRLVFMPLINPVGMYLPRRSNGNGVDLMRNAPQDAEEAIFLLSGHRISRFLPWYRGRKGDPMEAEAQAVCDFVKREVFQAKVGITVDVHSGFGTVDRLWFPYAKSHRPFSLLAEVYGIKKLLDQTYPNHFYRIEPQSKSYTAHGDLWDYLFDERQKQKNEGVYLPLSLEMGSWIWIKKNPWQLFSALGPFNPIKPHRRQRILRRHLIFFDFLARVIQSESHWTSLSPKVQQERTSEAIKLWYA